MRIEINTDTMTNEEVDKALKLLQEMSCCRTCKNFYQHYRRENGVYYEVNCGHCASESEKGRRIVKSTKPGDKRCDRYIYAGGF